MRIADPLLEDRPTDHFDNDERREHSRPNHGREWVPAGWFRTGATDCQRRISTSHRS
jgi:hypothetical protein